MTDDMARMDEFSRELSSVINRFSMENPSGTPDFILGDLLTSVLASYNDAVQKRAEWRMESVELPAIERLVASVAEETNKSHFQKVLDGIIDEQATYRQQYFEYLMSNPGFLATFGEDFVVEYRSMDLSTPSRHEYYPNNEYRVTFSQEVRFYRREAWESMQKANKVGLADEVRDLQAHLRAADLANDIVQVAHYTTMLGWRRAALTELGLRIDEHGNPESV